jgi:hypothetical protein
LLIGVLEQCEATGYLELFVDVVEVALDGPCANPEFVGNIPVVQATDDAGDHFALTWGQDLGELVLSGLAPIDGWCAFFRRPLVLQSWRDHGSERDSRNQLISVI